MVYTARVRAEYSTIPEKVGKRRGKQHASGRPKEVSNASQLLSELSLSSFSSVAKQGSSAIFIFEGFNSTFNFDPLLNSNLGESKYLNNCFVNYL